MQSIKTCDHHIRVQTLKQKEVSDVGRDLTRKLDLHRSTIEQREREVESEDAIWM